MEIAKLIRERRLELGLTMKQLGQKAGASESAVSRWEAVSCDKSTNTIYLTPSYFYILVRL